MAQQQAPPSDNVFVGDLPQAITQQAVQSVFQAYGNVSSVRVIPPNQPGKKAAALVRFGSVEEATWVVQNLHGNIAEGLADPIVVRFANSGQGKGSPGGDKGWGGKGGQQAWGGNQGGQQAWGADQSGQAWGGDQAWTPTKAGDNGAWQPQQQQPPQQQQLQKGGGKGLAQDNVYIADLPPTFTQEDCQRVFGQYGTIVSCRVMPSRMPGGNSQALVRFGTPDEAKWVVDNLNGNMAEGLASPIQARFANAPGQKGGKDDGGKGWAANRVEPYPAGGKDAKGGKTGKGKGKSGSFYNFYGAVKKAGLLGPGDPVPNEQQLFLRNLPMDTTDLDLYRLFSPFGALAPSGAKAMLNPDGSCKGIGFVDFVDPACAQAAINALNGFASQDGTTIAVTTKTSGKGGKDAPNPKGAVKGAGKDGGMDGSWDGSWDAIGAGKGAGKEGGVDASWDPSVDGSGAGKGAGMDPSLDPSADASWDPSWDPSWDGSWGAGKGGC